jgi:hypothetical protein
VRFAVVLVVATGCLDGIDPRWQLDHDRVVAARATPPAIPAGGTATLDALVSHKGAPVEVIAPAQATAAFAPDPLSTIVHNDGTGWTVVAPDEATLDGVRTQLGLPAGAPITVPIAMAFVVDGMDPLTVKKNVVLGMAADNPMMPPVNVDGGPPPDAIVVPPDTDVPMSVTVPDDWDVAWLTSCGTMHDDNERAAFLHVQPKDPQDGQLAIVIRDPTGGVAWQVWAISAGGS